MAYNRVLEWNLFSAIVREHILNYTIPQYGDSPDDEVEKWSPEMCAAALSKYIRRFGSQQRGREEGIRDMLKIAHFACLAYIKMGGNLVPKGYYDLKEGDYGYIEQPK